MYKELLRTHPLLSDQVDKAELSVLLAEAESVLARVEGDVVEFGCYVGTSSVFLRRLLNSLGSQSKLHVYDSFAGLPDKVQEDQSPVGTQFTTGELCASKATLVGNFKKAGLEIPVVHKGWFSELSKNDVPEKIAFAFLDGDYYQSIIDPLRLIWPKLSTGASVVIDDYQNEALPGASKAVDEWIRRHPAAIRVQSSLAILHPHGARA